MPGDTTISLAAALKTIWPQTDIWDEMNYGMPLWALMRKETDLAILNDLALGYGTSQGVSNDYASAKSAKQPSSLAGYKVPPNQIYSLASVDRQTIRLTRNNTVALFGAVDRTAQQAVLAWKFDASTQLWGNGGGALGQVLSITGNQILLTNSDDIVKFDKNMTVVACPDDGSGQVTAVTAPRTGQVLIGGVGRGASSTFSLTTTTGNWTDAGNIPGLAVNDYLFRLGNYGVALLGVGAYVPAADPISTDSFCGLNRYSDPLRLAGLRLTGGTRSPREAAMYMVQEAIRNSADPTDYFLNPTNFGNLQLELQSAGYMQVIKSAPAPIGTHVFGESVDGISFMGTGRQVKVYADARCPTGVGWGLQLDTWYISGGGDFPYLLNEDGLSMRKEEWSDGFEIEVVGDLQVMCEAPGLNTRISLAA